MLRQEISPNAVAPDPTALGLMEEPMVLMWPMEALMCKNQK